MNQFRMLWWWVAALLVASACVLVSCGAPTVLGQSATPGAATAPDWTFVVHGVQDPYTGVLTNPSQPVPGMRYVAFEVEVVNDSAQPLTFGANTVFLRDDEGFSYRGGSVAGGEPALQGRTMPGGERARGWVWFEVPEGATLREIVLVPTPPELGVGLDEVASIPGTPSTATTPTPDITPAPAATATQPAPPTATPLPTEPPAAEATATLAPDATVAPTSVIIIEGAESAETPEGAEVATATPAATATAAIVPSAPTATAPAVDGIEPGGTVINADSDVNLRDGPSLDAAIIGTIPLGSELSVTGPAVIGDDFIWWPVTVLATGEEGYVAEELLTPLGE